MRQALRTQRKSISPSLRRKAARALARKALRCVPLRRARRVAVYLSMGSELDTAPLIAALKARGIAVFAPALLRGGMHFRALKKTGLQAHALGMRQVRSGLALRASAMDVVMLPLLGFDDGGTRLGQGGGYYDRALSRARFRPYRLGLAYAQQQVDRLPRETWDMQLHAALTERGLQQFARTLFG
ncbi:MAG: 5-formyltetrahydrofolate cyclo-ligase [Pseudomonadota bacterium]